MKHLEPHDELGLPWDDLADGRAHRLVKGRDFVRGAELVEEAAANAAARLERVVRVYREVRRGAVFLWVQFVHHEIVYGEPATPSSAGSTPVPHTGSVASAVSPPRLASTPVRPAAATRSGS